VPRPLPPVWRRVAKRSDPMAMVTPTMQQVAPSKASLPAWAQLVREKYLAGEASTFVLYRNVFDIFLVGSELLDLKQPS
jgi:hypothetical protein